MKSYIVNGQIPALKFEFEQTVELTDEWLVCQVEQWVVGEIRKQLSAKGKKLILEIHPAGVDRETTPRTIII